MKTYPTLYFVTLTVLVSASAYAQVTLDGTLGTLGALLGPDYQIGADSGQQHGSNLFHSFQDFNLQSHESATFSGPDNVQNVISRVTGGNPSSIDGTLRSTIPNADLYFLNPYGIMFGPNAKLDLQGGFHVSTADYLQLSDGGKFDARQSNNSVLTVAPVEAFGFVTDSPAALSLQNSQLTVPYGQTFSLTGGNLSLTGAQVSAPGGQVTLTSLAQAGQLALANPTLSGKGGTIELQNQSKVSTSGIGGGKVLIRGGQLVIDNSTIEAATLGNQDGKGIDIVTNESVNIKGTIGTPTFSTGIGTPTFGTGNGGNVQITTPRLEMTNSYVDTSSLGRGKGGNIEVQANQVTVAEGTFLVSEAMGSGAGGSVRVNARDSLTITGQSMGESNFYGLILKDYPSHIAADSLGPGQTGEIHLTTHHLSLDGGFITMVNSGLTDAQNITIEADSVILKEGGLIASDTFGDHAGGNITLKVAGDLTIMGRKSTITIFPPPFNVAIEAMQSTITSGTLGKGPAGRITVSANRLVMQEGNIGSNSAGGTGPAGRIQITVNELLLNPGGRIASNSGILLGKTLLLGTGDGGEVQVEVTGLLRIQGWDSLGVPSSISSNTLTTGRGGSVTVRANHLQLSDSGLITANSLGLGDAGELMIQANTLEIFDDGQITTSAQQAAGGDIHLTVANQLHLRHGQLTTSVMGGVGDGGNIIIAQPQFTILNKGLIRAQADAGNGGNIRIVAEQFIATPDSLVSASSKLGIDGQVMISSPDPNLSSKLFLVSTNGLDVTNQLKRPCGSAKSLEEIMNPRFKFYVYPIAGSRQSVEDWGPSPLPSRSARVAANGKTETVRGKTTEGGMDRSGYPLGRLMVECLKEEKTVAGP